MIFVFYGLASNAPMIGEQRATLLADDQAVLLQQVKAVIHNMYEC